MKQKLLNSFTWRATLLVAFLSFAFTSAWGQQEKTYKLSEDNNVSTTWKSTTNGVTYSKSDISFSGDFTISTSSFTNVTVTGVTVKAYRETQGQTYGTISLKVGGTTISAQDLGSPNSPTQCSFSEEEYFSDNNKIEIIMDRTGGNKKLHITSIQVTYIPKATFSISAQCALDGKYYGTYSNDDWAFVVPNDVTVSKVSVNGGELSVPPLSGIVSKKTGVLVSSESAGDKSVFVSKKDATADVDGNMLVASSVEMSGTDSYFYHLTFNDSNPLGFYWGKSDGGAWPFSGTNKAYLKVLKTYSGYSAVKGFTLSDSADGIKAIETEKNSEMVFNLAGQRVSKMQKGIYVVNGKKILVK